MSPNPSRARIFERAVGLFRVDAAPMMARGHYPVERNAWALLGFTLGAVEGGVVGVVVKNAYTGAVPDIWLNFAVAVVAGAPAFSNVLSFVWAGLAHGRAKIPMLVRLQLLCALAVLTIALAPISAGGLVLLMSGAIAARVFWSGVVTLRSVVWRANYPRNLRAVMTGRLATLTAVLMAGTGMAVGFVMDFEVSAFRWVYPLVAAAGLWAAWIYRRVKVRHHGAMLRAEGSAGPGVRRGVSPATIFEVLRSDADFRAYMFWMFIFGGGNLMVSALVILILSEQLGVTQFTQVMITSSLPLVVIPLTVPLWGKLLDARHVVLFRCRHSWSFVSAIGLFAAGAVFQSVALFWLGSVMLGIAFAGGLLGWNLGHNDFASERNAATYMGVHVTLTGVRGLIGPILGVALYELLETHTPGSGRFALLLPLTLSLVGAMGFIGLARRLKREGKA